MAEKLKHKWQPCFYCSNLSHHTVGPQSWLPQVRKWSGEKISLRSGKSQGILLWVNENLSLWKKSGKSVISRVNIYSLPSTFVFFKHLKFLCTFYGHMNNVVLVEYLFTKLNDKLMLGFQESQFFLRVMLRNYQFIDNTIYCKWLAESIRCLKVISPKTRVKLPEMRSHVAPILSGEVHRET